MTISMLPANSPTPALCGTAILLTISACAYFRATGTALRDFELFRSLGGHAEQAFELAKRRGPIPWRDRGVWLRTFVFVAPVALSPLIAKSIVHDVLFYVALGIFLNPLTAPSAYSLDKSLVSRPLDVLTRLILLKLDSFLKTLVAVAVGFGLAFIPGLGSMISRLGSMVLAVVPGKPSSTFFAQLAGALGLWSVVMIFLYMMKLSQHGVGLMIALALGTSVSWVSYQWFVNEVFVPYGSLAIFLPMGVLLGFLFDCLIEYVNALTN